jgi:hypothetical protein
MHPSGNHGRSSSEPPPQGISGLTPSTTPQQSVRSFVAPASVPIKKTPDITDIIGENRNTVEAESDEAESRTQKAESDEAEENLTVLPSYHLTVSNDFPTQWRSMFNQVFASVPTIFIPFKEMLPEIENNIIKVTVKNIPQKEHFEAKTREALAYLRTHCNEEIEDIIVETNEQLETKKIIYDIKDKLQNFKEQNTEFNDFIQILDLKIKD